MKKLIILLIVVCVAYFAADKFLKRARSSVTQSVVAKITANNERKSAHILANFSKLSAAGEAFAKTNGTTQVRFDDIVGAGKLLESIESIDEENYRQFDYSPNTNSWMVTLKTGREVAYVRPK